MPTTDENSERRYDITPGLSIEVVVRRQSNQSPTTLLGELHTLSLSNAQLFLPNLLKFSEAIELQINIPDARVKIDASAAVSWIRPTTDDQCLVGCSLGVRLSEAVLDRLATAGVIDRRRHPRRIVDVPAAASWPAETEPHPVRIIDYSQGGFCITSARPCSVGQAVTIEFDDNHHLTSTAGTVCWQEERDGEYALGCSVALEDIEPLLRYCDRESDSPRASSFNSTPVIHQRVFLAATWLLVLVGGTVLTAEVVQRWQDPATKLQPHAQRQEQRLKPSATPMFLDEPTQDVTTASVQSSDNPPANVDFAYPPSEATPQRMKPRADLVSESAQPTPLLDQIPTNSMGATSQPLVVETDEPIRQSDAQHEGSTSHSSLEGSLRVQQPQASSIVQSSEPSSAPSEQVVSDPISPLDQALERPTQGDTAIIGHENPPPSGTRQVVHELGGPDTAGSRRTATIAFGVGARQYRAKRFDKALDSLQTAVRHDPRNALYHYVMAMTLYQLQRPGDAEAAARKAVELDREVPVENLGSRLSRYQGHARVWLEQLRSKLSMTTASDPVSR